MLVVLVIVHSPGVVRGDDFPKGKTIDGVWVDDWDATTPKCGCEEKNMCSLSQACGWYQYCENSGNQPFGNDFKCRQCQLYFSKTIAENKVSISSYQTVKTLPVVRGKLECVDVGLDVVCYKTYETIPLSEIHYKRASTVQSSQSLTQWT